MLGVIEAFHHLGGAGQNSAAMGNVMAGIAEALIATGVGLLVAIPAVVAYNLIQKSIGDIESGVVSISELLIACLKASPAPTGATRSPPTPERATSSRSRPGQRGSRRPVEPRRTDAG